MKRLLIVFLAVTITFAMAGCDLGSENQDVSQTESDVCEEHSSELVFSPWGECNICEAIEGKSFGTQCETWEDVVALAGFSEYSYEFSVSEYENVVIITLTFDENGQFTDNDWVSWFMHDSYLAFVGISWFTQNKSSVATPDKFQKYVLVNLEFPGGEISYQPDDYFTFSPIGILTRLYVDEESPNKFMIERLYNLFFKTVILPEAGWRNYQ